MYFVIALLVIFRRVARDGLAALSAEPISTISSRSAGRNINGDQYPAAVRQRSTSVSIVAKSPWYTLKGSRDGGLNRGRRVMERAQEKTHAPVPGQSAASLAHASPNTKPGTKLGKADVSRHGAARWPGLRRLLDKPLTSYYLVLGITTLLIAIGVLLAKSIYSVQQLDRSVAPNSLLQHQLMGVAIGFLCMWLAARSSSQLFRAFAYPLLALAVVGLCLTLVRGVGVSQNGAARWIEIGGQQLEPSEIAKPALAVWGADLLARKEQLGQLADWRHMLVPLMPGASLLCLLVMSGDDLGTTFILLVIFLALLWVVGIPGRVFSGILILMALAIGLVIISASYRSNHLMVFLHLRGGPDMQTIQLRRTFGSGGWFGVGLGASNQKWSSVPNVTNNFVFAILGEDLGLLVALGTTVLYGGLAYAGIRIARSVNDIFVRLAATGITAWIVVQAFFNIGSVLGLFPVTDILLPLISYSPPSLLITMIALGMLMSFARREPDAIRAISAKTGRFRGALSWLWWGRVAP